MASFEDIDILSELPFDEPWVFEEYFVPAAPAAPAAPASRHEVQMKALNSQLAFERQKTKGASISASPIAAKPGRLTVEMLRNELRDPSSPGTDIYDSPTYQKARRGKRMVCATCQKDAPVSDKNDGKNCTRCFNKLLKTRGSMTPSLTPSLTPSPKKRAYDEYAVDEHEGYSSGNSSPSKQPAADQYDASLLWNLLSSGEPAVDPHAAYPQSNMQISPLNDPADHQYDPSSQPKRSLVEVYDELSQWDMTAQPSQQPDPDPYEGYTQWVPDYSPSKRSKYY